MSKLSAIYETRTITLDQVVHRIDEISTLPEVALRVLQIANNPDAGVSDLRNAVERDAALSSRVLRCVNSAAYSLRNRVTNLQQAIAYLGLKQVRNLATTASVSDLFKKECSIGAYRRMGLWRHLVSVGIAARLIAMRRSLANFEDIFLAGLLHDIGIILEDQHCHLKFSEVIRSLQGQKTLIEAEHSILGFDHAGLGAKVAETWNFPPAVRAAIQWHHASAAYRGEDIAVLQCVEVANLICSLKGITSIGTQRVKSAVTAMAALRLTKQDLLVLTEDLDGEFTRNASLFQL